MPRAIPVTKNNINYIIDYADKLGFDLSHLHDSLEDLITYRDIAGKQEVLYLITDGHVEHNNITFTEMIGADFDRLWKFTMHELPTSFTKIEKI